MATNHEIEFKQLLTAEQYDEIKAQYFKHDTPFTQTNYYFDTADMRLRDARVALRIRSVDQTYEMTLKVPADVGLTEHNVYVDYSPEHIETLTVDTLPEQIQTALHDIDPSIHTLHLLGALTTHRLEIPIHDNLLVLDHSEYLDTEDYELEFEVQDPDSGFYAFNILLEVFEIEPARTPNKVERFFQRKLELDA